MTFYIVLTIWMFFMLIIGMHPDAMEGECLSSVDLRDSHASRNNKRIISVLTIFTFLILWFLTAFRSAQIGNDTNTYLYYFNIYSRGIDRSRTFEIGYQYLNYCIGRITTNPHYFIVIIATIMYAGAAWFIHKFSNNRTVSLVLFYCYFFSLFTTIFRQGIAMIIVIFGYQWLKEGKKLRAALLFLIAMAFHTTAIVSFLFFLNARFLKKKKVVFAITALCGIISGTGIINTIVNAIVPRYSHYFDSRYAESGWLAVSYSLIVYLIYFILVSKSAEDNKTDQIVATNFMLLLIFAAFGFSVNLFTRAGEYFLLIAVIEIPNMLSRGKVKHHRLWTFGLCSFLLIMFIVTLVFRPGWNHLYPYEFWG